MRHEAVDAKSQKRNRMPLNLNEAILETFPEFMSSVFGFFSVLSGFIER
jgi:hypothetical protein